MALLICGGSLIQSGFTTSGQPNFEAVIFQPGPKALQHYYRENHRPDRTWTKLKVVNEQRIGPVTMHVFDVTGPGAMIQAAASLLSRGHFEVVVPEPGGLAHYWRDNDDLDAAWVRTGVFVPGSTGPGALVQNPENGHLEVTARIGDDLFHFWRDESLDWHRTEPPITRAAAGPPALIWSSYGNLELVVQEGSRLVLYWRDRLTQGLPWRPGGVVAPRVTGAPAFTQGPFGSGEHNNFEVAVPVDDRVELWWRDNSDGNLPWKPGGIITQGAGLVSAVALTASNYDDRLEVLTQEAERSIFHSYRYAVSDDQRIWYRHGCIQIDEGPFVPTEDRVLSVKVNQVTGERDHQEQHPTQSQTESRYRLRGTDLGASFEHNGQLFFLFGDTHWLDNLLPTTADSIAYTPDTDPWNGLTVYFHRSYLKIRWPDVPDIVPFDWRPDRQGEYDVPLDGFSFRGQMFVFFSTDHYRDRKVMGRSILTRGVESNPIFEQSNYRDPLTFDYLAEFSRLKFINVSVERVDDGHIRRFNLPASREGLLIWGTGAYRADHVYLAFLPLDEDDVIAALLGAPFDGRVPRIHYFAGGGPNGARWSRDEREAVPLFFPAAIGELSVRWNNVLGAWMLMYMAGPDDPIGAAACLRLSRTPWGPWSKRRKVFDWVQDGLGWRIRRDNPEARSGWFMHVNSDTIGFDDRLGDEIIGGVTTGGGAYAPYQIPRYTRQDHGEIQLFYLLSAWNPYQVELMRHSMTLADRGELVPE